MLGKLFSTAASTLSPRTSSNTPNSSRPTTSLCSVQEDLHTRSLLFPDSTDLAQSQHDQVFPLSSSPALHAMPTSAYDVDGDVDIDLRDVRIIVMQEETATHQRAALLYDSHALPSPSNPADRHRSNTNGSSDTVSRNGSRRSTQSIQPPRKISVGQSSRPVVISTEHTAANFGSAFDRNRRLSTRGISSVETEDQRAAREYREEIKTFSDCIFGSQIMAYKGTGTKMHIVPNDAKTSHYGTFAADHQYGSFGRSSMRNSKLSQSYTSESVSPLTPGGRNGSPPAPLERKKILITRIFSVPLPNDDVTDDTQNDTPTLHSSRAEEGTGYPFPKVDDPRPTQEKKKLQPKQKRTPMYAVALVITLPATSSGSSSTTRSSASRGPGSYTEQQDSFPSSFNSAKGVGWTMLSGIESLDSSLTSDNDLRVDNITHHWDIIMRTMSQLQSAMSIKVLALLRHADLASPDPSRIATQLGGRLSQDGKVVKPPKTTTRLVQLNPNALVPDEEIQKEIKAARKRVVCGINAQQVVTGQGRWGIWREEARWVGKWAGGREEGFFFFNLLTSFLGNHTEWLHSLGPPWYRRRHYQQQRANKDEIISVPTRTVIISEDKIIARKLIFLLSAFLPANQQVTGSKVSHLRPSTSASAGGYSQSPPTHVREESLRRQINKRGSVGRGAHSRTRSFPAQQNQRSSVTTSLLNVETFQDRRISDSGMTKSANLPIPGKEARNTSVATTATVTPATTMPHFSTRTSHRGTGPSPRPGSSGSFVTEDLIRSLNRVESAGHDSAASTDSQGQNSVWGSMLSSLWSNTGTKRRDSAATTPPTTDGLEINTHIGKKIQPKIKSANAIIESNRGAEKQISANVDSVSPRNNAQFPLATSSESRAKSPSLHRAGSSTLYESPVKSSVNEDDGVIDIDVPLPDFLTSSFGSIRSSPSSSGYLSNFGHGLEGFEHSPRLGLENEAPMNVGGWLKHYHPDFTLQATPSHAGLEENIKASMRAEPTPALSNGLHSENVNTDRWVDICTTIIADANNFTIKRIRYSRLIRAKPTVDPNADMANFFYPTSSIHATNGALRYGNMYTPQLTPAADAFDTIVDDKFVEEPIMSMDETLIDAVERIIAQSGEASRVPSAASSRSVSRKGSKIGGGRERSNSLSTTANGNVVKPQIGLVKPNECKKMVLSALEEIAKSVAEGRSRDDVELGERGESVLREGIRKWLTSVEESQ